MLFCDGPSAGQDEALLSDVGFWPILRMSLLQASSRGYDRLPQFGAAGKHGLARGDQERLLMKLRVMGLLQDDTARQEQHGSIVSVLSVHQVSR